MPDLTVSTAVDGFMQSATRADMQTAINLSFTSAAPAFGFGCTTSIPASSAFGFYCSASAFDSSAFGSYSTASGSSSSAFGRSTTASGNASSAFGYRAKTTVANTAELGYWSNATTRGSAIRLGGGMAALPVVNSATEPSDGGATAGSEAAGALPRGMWSIRRNGLSFILDYNDAGTVKNLTLGTVS